ncbi:MAG TPA: hypothetical protein VLB06_03825 [Sulfuricaulis sp.]|nr:hypothetical protein [Sulfuricaulis sp.]
MKRRFYPLTSYRVLLSVCFLLGAESAANADCTPPGSAAADTIICTGTDTDGVASEGGNDSVTVTSGALIMLDPFGIRDPKAFAVDAGDDRDAVFNLGDIVAKATAVLTPIITPPAFPGSNIIYNALIKVAPEAKGIDGGAGNDTITNTGSVSSISSATTLPGLPAILEGIAKADISAMAKAESTAIDGGDNDDTVTNSGSLTVDATATAIGASASLAPTKEEAGKSKLIGDVKASASASGLAGGAGTDTITNLAAFDVTSSSFVLAEGASIIESNGSAAASVKSTSESNAIAIDSGGGDDTLSNNEKITATADATAIAVNAALGGKRDTDPAGKTKVAAEGGATGNSTAIGIAADSVGMPLKEAIKPEVKDAFQNGGIDLAAKFENDFFADGNSVAYKYSVSPNALAIGNDVVTNSAEIAANATATSSALGIGVSFEGNASAKVKSEAEATAAAIDLGGGNDTLTNTSNGKLTATSIATAFAIDVAVGGEPEPGNIDKIKDKAALGGGNSAKSAATGIAADGVSSEIAAVADYVVDDASTTYRLSVTPEANLAGDDSVTNGAEIEANATAVNVAAGVGVTTKGNASADTESEAESAAVAIDLGGGNDTLIDNTGKLTATAISTAINIDVAVGDKSDPAAKEEVTSAVKGGATAHSLATGISADGEGAGTTYSVELVSEDTRNTINVSQTKAHDSGDDNITNNAEIGVEADAYTIAAGVGVTVNGKASADVKSESEATAAAIDLGGGNDTLSNTGLLTSTAFADASSLSVSVGVESGSSGKDGSRKNGSKSESAADGSATAKSIAIGISADGVTGDTQRGGKLVIEDKGPLFGYGLVLGYNQSEAHAIGNDVVTNDGDIEAHAMAGAHAAGVGVTVKGAAAAKSTSTSESTASAIDLGRGEDILTNTGKLTVTADSLSEALKVAVSTEGKVQSSDGFWNGGIKSEANAKGIYAAGAPDSSTVAEVSVDDNGVNVQYETTKGDIAVVPNKVSAGDTADGNDSVTNYGDISTHATATSDAKNVAVTSKGTASTISHVEAKAESTGITGGNGDDVIQNLLPDPEKYPDLVPGQMTVVAESQANAGKVTVSGKGVAVDANGLEVKADASWESGTQAEAIAVGIDGDGGTTDTMLVTAHIGSDGVKTVLETNTKNASGADTILNEQAIAVTAKADAPSLGVALVAEKGLAATVTSVGSEATATAIRGGSGDDNITNSGKLTSTAEASASAASIAIATKGLAASGSIWDGGTEAVATAIGIDADGGERTKTTNTTLTINDGGATIVHIKTTDSAGGNDTVDNYGDIEANATATSLSLDAAITTKGLSAISSQSSTAATAVAIHGGDGVDTITNSGTLTSTAWSSAVPIGISPTEGGFAVASNAVWEGGTTAKAAAIGIDADGGERNTQSTITIKSGGDDRIDTKNSQEEARGNDAITNTGQIDASATAIATAPEIALAWKGVASAISTSTAEAEASAIDAGDGNDHIDNLGLLTAKAFANADTVNVAISSVGVTLANDATFLGGTVAHSTAAGLKGGSGDDTINNGVPLPELTNPPDYFEVVPAANDLANIETTARAVAPSIGVSVELAGVAAAETTATAKAAATSISGGDGNDTVTNRSQLTTTVFSNADAFSVSYTTNGVAVAGNDLMNGGVKAQAVANGIDGDGVLSETIRPEFNLGENDTLATFGTVTTYGGGNDAINNVGAVDTTGTAVAAAVGVGMTWETGLAAAVTTSTADVRVSGINGGGGTDSITNAGVLTTHAYANADSVNVSLVGAGVAVTADAVLQGGSNIVSRASGITADGVQTETDRVTLSSTNGGQQIAYERSTDYASGNDIIINRAKIDTSAASFGPSIGVSISAGAAVSAANVTSTASSTAIDGGDGADVIDNTAELVATATGNADALNIAVAPFFAVAADALQDGGATARARAVGIDSDGMKREATTVTVSHDANGSSLVVDQELVKGSGADTITNTGKIDATASAFGPSIGISVVATGAGAAVTTMTADAEAIAIDSGADADTITNSGELNATATSDALTVNVGVVPTGGVALAGDAVWNGGTTATANAVGIRSDGVQRSTTRTTINHDANGFDSNFDFSNDQVTGDVVIASGNDVVTNNSAINLTSKAYAPTIDVAVSVAGVAGVLSTATAEAHSTGIDTGAGNDSVYNGGAITTFTKANADAINVAVTPAGVAVTGDAAWTGGTHAHAAATGIDAGDGVDTVTNAALLDLTVRSVAPSLGVPIEFYGVSSAVTDATAFTEATGIDAGGGADTVDNINLIRTDAYAEADSLGVSVNVFGLATANNAVWSGGTHSQATTIGIDGGGGNDVITNTGGSEDYPTIAVSSTALSAAGNVPFSFGGVAAALTTATARADATAISGGDGEDTIFNYKDSLARSDSTAVAATGSIGVFGVALASDSVWNGGTHSSAYVIGIDGGKDKDTLINSALLDARSISRANSDQVSVTVIGVAGSIATSTSTAESSAMDGGDGDDTITNHKTVNAVADARATSVAVDISGLGAAVAADAFWDGGTHADATAYGISGGNGNDTLNNTANGVINVGLTGTEDAPVSADTDSVGVAATLGIVAGANATSTAITHATAIDAGTGNDLVVNRGALNVNTLADAGGVSVSFIGGGASIADSYFDAVTKAEANGVGIAGDAGEDTIYSMENSTTNVNATAATKDTAVGLALIGFSTADASTQSITRASGISGGDGRDWIYQYGTTTVTAHAETLARSFTLTEVGATIPDANGAAEVYAYGIDAGLGDLDKVTEVTNSGTLSAEATVNATGQSIGLLGTGAALGNASTSGKAEAFGMYAKDGLNALSNSGSLSATGTADVTAKSVGLSLIGYTVSKADATAEAHATGMQGGLNQDTLTNYDTGKMDVTATSTANAKGVSINLIGAARSDAIISPTATAVAMYGGAGDVGITEMGMTDDEILNAGTLNVSASSTSTISNSSWELAGAAKNIPGSVGMVTQATAIGIAGGAGNDAIINRGSLNADAVSQANLDGSAWTLAGKASDEITTSADTHTTGIAGGDDADWIQNEGTINVTGSAGTTITGGARTVFGGTHVDGEAIADIVAAGVDTGAGQDVMLNLGTIKLDVASDALTENNAKSGFITGTANTVAKATGTATGQGVTTGDGDTRLQNNGAIDVKVQGTGYAFSLADGAKLSWNGNGVAAANSTAHATAGGILTGDGNNHIVNNNLISVLARTTTVKSLTTTQEVCSETAQVKQVCTTTTDPTTGDPITTCEDVLDGNGNPVYEIVSNCQDEEIILDTKPTYAAANGNGASGDGNASSTATSTAVAYGIKVGDGNNTIINNQAINVTASPDAEALVSVSGGTTGDATGNVTARANASAYGIWAGNGNNGITNNGTLDVIAAPKAQATADVAAGKGVCIHFLKWEWCIADGNGTGTATASLDSLAVGIRAGDGDNVIVNNGIMTVRATPESDGAPAIVTPGIYSRTLNPSVTSLAVGIETGNGYNQISNDTNGVIDVAATDLAGYGCAPLPCSSSATGIQTGDGNNLIINDGVITTSVTMGGNTHADVAIRTGSGNDIVQLGDGSTTIGSIQLNGGDDSLTFIGSASVAGLNDAPGSLNGGAGTDSLYFSGSGSFTGSIQQFENAAKDGAGTFTLSGLPTMQQLKISQGTLQTNSAYSFATGGSYEAWIYGGGDHGTLLANDGTASLAGILSVNKGHGAYINGTTYDVVEATQGVSGAFSDVLLPAPSPLLHFSYQQTPSAAQIEANVASFTTMATNSVGRAVATYLDTVLPTASGNLSDALGNIQSLSAPDLSAAYASLSPDTYNSSTQAAAGEIAANTGSLRQRMQNMRLGEIPGGTRFASFSDNKPVMLAYDGTPDRLGRLLEDGDDSRHGTYGLWINAFGQQGDQDSDNTHAGFHYNVAGTTLGFDHDITNDIMAGVSVGYARSNLNLDQNLGNGDINATVFSAYGSYFTHQAYVEGALSFGNNRFANSRNILIAGANRVATSYHDGRLFSGLLAGGYYYKVSGWTWEPFASLQYSSLQEDSFDETGAGAVSLHMDERRTQYFASDLGLRFRRMLERANGILVPELSLAWNYNFNVDNTLITASFTGAPNSAFTVQGQDIERNGARLGGGVAYVNRKGLTSAMYYAAELRNGYTAQALTGEIRYEFK